MYLGAPNGKPRPPPYHFVKINRPLEVPLIPVDLSRVNVLLLALVICVRPAHYLYEYDYQ